MKLHTKTTEQRHVQLHESYKERLAEVEKDDKNDEVEVHAPFERTFLHNAIYLHNLWFEQLQDNEESESPLLNEILERRESDLGTFQTWLNLFAQDAQPNGWAVWGWSYPLKTFVGFPIKGHDNNIPLGITPILVIDCWEHSYIEDYGLDFEEYLSNFWHELNWQVIESRHQELAAILGFNIK